MPSERKCSWNDKYVSRSNCKYVSDNDQTTKRRRIYCGLGFLKHIYRHYKMKGAILILGVAKIRQQHHK